jgi:hypothetical protein
VRRVSRRISLPGVLLLSDRRPAYGYPFKREADESGNQTGALGTGGRHRCCGRYARNLERAGASSRDICNRLYRILRFSSGSDVEGASHALNQGYRGHNFFQRVTTCVAAGQREDDPARVLALTRSCRALRIANAIELCKQRRRVTASR